MAAFTFVWRRAGRFPSGCRWLSFAIEGVVFGFLHLHRSSEIYAFWHLHRRIGIDQLRIESAAVMRGTGWCELDTACRTTTRCR